MAPWIRRARDFAYWRWRRGRNFAKFAWRKVGGVIEARKRFAPHDPRISFPCYKSLDEHLDVERLVSLDGILEEQVRRYLRSGRGERFDTGFMKRRIRDRAKPGSRVIELTTSLRPVFRYHDLRYPELWRPAEAAQEFPELMDFIEALPFAARSRVLIMCDEKGRAVTQHRDHAEPDILHEFVWFRTNLDKPFYLIDRDGRQRRYVASHTAWFDTVNQFHGAEATGGLSVSIRVDGVFSDDFRARIPKPELNVASTPSLWACLSGEAPPAVGDGAAVAVHGP